MKDTGFSWFAAIVISVMAFSLSFAVGYCSNTTQVTDTMDSIQTQTDTLVLTDLNMSRDNFFLVCNVLEIKFPEVVYAQARLESGNFTSAHYNNRNNCLGIYDSKRKRYMSFNHWTDCLLAYRDKVQYRYKRNSDREDYLRWLVETGYAQDPNYISKIRKILK